MNKRILPALALACGLCTPWAQAAAAGVYTFTYSGANVGSNGVTYGEINGSISIPETYFTPGSSSIVLPNSDITAMSFMIGIDSNGSLSGINETASFGLSSLESGTTTFSFTGSLPQLTSGTGFVNANGYSVFFYCCNANGLGLGLSFPNATTEVGGGWATTVQLGVPEPSTWALMLSGLLGVGLAAHGRRRIAAA